jgi:aldehyde dehydrogenase (NAD+)
VLDDADLEKVLPLAVHAAFMNNGQACIAGTRLLVPRARMGEAGERLRMIVAGIRVGDPRDPATQVGPLASLAQYERVQRYIRRGLEQGATLLAGGEGKPESLHAGFFVRPTVFTDVANDMDIAREEIFGPVLSVIAYDDEDDAVRIANDSPYGLQAYVFSSRTERAAALAPRLEAGTVLVNRITPDLVAPFGGFKQSGIGREFGVFGLEAFLEPKTVSC